MSHDHVLHSHQQNVSTLAIISFTFVLIELIQYLDKIKLIVYYGLVLHCVPVYSPTVCDTHCTYPWREGGMAGLSLSGRLVTYQDHLSTHIRLTVRYPT